MSDITPEFEPVDVPEAPAKTSKGVYTSTERLYEDKAGKVVKANDPTRVRLLICEGGMMPLAKALALGLTTGEVEVVEVTQEAKTIVENKALPTTPKTPKPRQAKATKAADQAPAPSQQ